MNKIKLKIASSKLFDETAIIDVFYNGNKVIKEYVVSTDGSEIIFDVESNENLYNSIKIDTLNSSIELLVPIKDNLYNDNNSLNNTEILPIDSIEDIMIFLLSVEISSDGVNWFVVTPGEKNNPQEIRWLNGTNILGISRSKFWSKCKGFYEINWGILESNKCLPSNDYEYEYEFFIPSVDRISNINSIMLDNNQYENFNLDEINKTINKKYPYYSYNVQINSDQFDAILESVPNSVDFRNHNWTYTTQ